jgi:uncharacterized protein with HEPN domain
MSRDEGLLEDMLREARMALVFVEGMSEADFVGDDKTRYAVVRCLEIIGEAASGISEETRKRIAAIPWSVVIGQRHVAIHHYRRLETPRIWATVKDDLPPLITAIEAYLP